MQGEIGSPRRGNSYSSCVVVLVLEKSVFLSRGACIPRGLFLRKDPGVGRAPAQLTVEDEDEGRSILIREVLSLLAPLRHNGQITKGHPTGGSNTG